MMKRRAALSRIVALAAAAGAVWCAAATAVAAPAISPQILVAETFELGTLPAYTASPVNSYPAAGSAYGYWAPTAYRAHTGGRGLWCDGTYASAWPSYLSFSAGRASFELTSTSEMYESALSVWYTMPSRGFSDSTSFNVYWAAPPSLLTDPHYDMPLTAAGAWRQLDYSLSSAANTIPLSRRSGRVVMQWIDSLEGYGQTPMVGEGPSVDDLTVTGWKYGPVRAMSATTTSSGVRLEWSRPHRSTAMTSTEERSLSYRVWKVPAGGSTWTEITSARIESQASTVATTVPLPGEGASYTYAVQAWDTGSGTGYGRMATATVAVPAIAPSVTMSTPYTGFALSPTPLSIAGSATDIGSGVSGVQVRLRRSDGLTYNGISWTSADAWLAASSSDGYATWILGWTPDAATLASGLGVTVSVRARDYAGLYSPEASAASSFTFSRVAVAAGATLVTAPEVTVSLEAFGATHMRHHVDAGPPTSWITFGPSAAVTLPSVAGTHVVTFDLSADGGLTWATASDDIELHTSVPSISIATPASGFALNTGEVSFTGSAADVGGSVSSVSVRLRRSDGSCWDGSAWTASETWLPAATGDGYATWNLAWTPDAETAISGAKVTATARARDVAGLEGLSSGVYSGVGYAAVSVADGASFVSTTEVAAAVEAPGATHMRYRVDAGAPTSWAAFGPSAPVALPGVDGTHTVTFDLSVDGGATWTSVSDDIVLHTSVPTVSIAAPTGGFTLNAGEVLFSGSAADAGGSVSSVSVRLRRADGSYWDGSTWTAAETWLPATTGDGYTTWNLAWTPDAALLSSGDDVTAVARASDAFGITRATTGVVSSVPMRASVTLADGAPFVATTTVSARFVTAGATHVRYRLIGSPVSTWTPLGGAVLVPIPASDGPHPVTFDFSPDGVSSGISEVATITLDTTAPEVVPDTPTQGFDLMSENITVTAHATDAGSGVDGLSVQVIQGGRCWNGDGWQAEAIWLPLSREGSGPWTYVWTPDDAARASHLPVELVVRATDGVGNRASTGGVVSLDPPDPTQLVASCSQTLLSAGQRLGVSGTLTSFGEPVPAGTVALQSLVGTRWSNVVTLPTDAEGSVRFSVVSPASRTTYRLQFEGTPAHGAGVSEPFTVVPRSYLSVRSSASVINKGAVAWVSGTLGVASLPATGCSVSLQSLVSGAWRAVGSRVTDSAGQVSFGVSPTVKTTYRLAFLGNDRHEAVVSPGLSITPRVSLSRPSGYTSVKRTTYFRISTIIAPAHGLGTYPVKVLCYRRESGRWVLRRSYWARVVYNSWTASRCTALVRLPYAGTWRVRAYAPADAQHASMWSVAGPSITVR